MDEREISDIIERTRRRVGDPGTPMLARQAAVRAELDAPAVAQPGDGVFATLDAGAATTVGLYFMYDVKQFDPAEWTSPPLEARIIDKPGLGKVMMGRGAVNQKGPQAALLAALHAIRGAGGKLPVTLPGLFPAGHGLERAATLPGLPVASSGSR